MARNDIFILVTESELLTSLCCVCLITYTFIIYAHKITGDQVQQLYGFTFSLPVYWVFSTLVKFFLRRS